MLGHWPTGPGRSVGARPGREHQWPSSGKGQKQEPSLKAAFRAGGDDLSCWGFSMFTKPSGFGGFLVLVFLWKEKQKSCWYILALSVDLRRCQQGLSVWRTTPGGCPLSPHCSGTGWGSLRVHTILELLAPEGSPGFPELRGNPTCSEMFMIWFQHQVAEGRNQLQGCLLWIFHALSVTKIFCWCRTFPDACIWTLSHTVPPWPDPKPLDVL